MTHPSLEEALDEINPRATIPWEILDNKTSNECHRHGMMESMFPPIDIHEETPLELEKEDDIDEHGSYEIFNPLMLPVHKDFERVVVYAYVYHKYCKSH